MIVEGTKSFMNDRERNFRLLCCISRFRLFSGNGPIKMLRCSYRAHAPYNLNAFIFGFVSFIRYGLNVSKYGCICQRITS